ncbi:MAG: TerB family tellurite resistance protein [Ignavibacteriaceae bacterium]|nr:TerB family tellurite resistance protein [Ignavibacteriaceae bacterium]
MDIPILDKSKYLKGLLVIAKKDNQLNEQEKKFIRGIANKLGFATDFYEDTLKGLMSNKYISEDPVEFSDKKIAQSFVTDGLRLAIADEVVTENEIKWLKETAAANGLEDSWFNEKLKLLKETPSKSIFTEYALYSII